MSNPKTMERDQLLKLVSSYIERERGTYLEVSPHNEHEPFVLINDSSEEGSVLESLSRRMNRARSNDDENLVVAPVDGSSRLFSTSSDGGSRSFRDLDKIKEKIKSQRRFAEKGGRETRGGGSVEVVSFSPTLLRISLDSLDSNSIPISRGRLEDQKRSR